jgi:hypothetical protein
MPSWKKVIVSGSDATLNSLTVSNGITGSLLGTASFASNGGVTQLLAGANVTLSPTNGKGQVTVSSTSGGGGFNTATGSYGSFYDTTTQTNPVANIARSMSLNTTAITNGVSVSGSTNPFNTYIKTENAGVYNIQFSAQLDKTDSGNDEVFIWLRKNGIDLTDTATTITLIGNNGKQVAAWNWFVNSAANDYYQIIWQAADTEVRLYAEPADGTPGIPSVIVTANRVDQFLSNTGSFTGSFTGVFTGSLFGTSSFATSASQAITASFITTAQTASFVTGSNVFGPFGSNSITSASFAISSSRAVTSSFAISSSNALTASFYGGTVSTASFASTASNVQGGAANYIPLWNTATSLSSSVIYQLTGNIGIRTTTPSASLHVAGTTLLSGSLPTISGSILTVIGSGSTQPIFTVQGSQGELFSVTDSLSGSLFSVNDISGLPILEVFSDNTTLLGDYQDPMLITTKKNVLTNSGSFTVYSLPTASYDTAFFEYSIRSGSNARAGQIMAIQSGSAVNYTETTTTDFGSTSGLSFNVSISGSNMVLTGSAATTAWTIKTIIRSI